MRRTAAALVGVLVLAGGVGACGGGGATSVNCVRVPRGAASGAGAQPPPELALPAGAKLLAVEVAGGDGRGERTVVAAEADGSVEDVASDVEKRLRDRGWTVRGETSERSGGEAIELSFSVEGHGYEGGTVEVLACDGTFILAALRRSAQEAGVCRRPEFSARCKEAADVVDRLIGLQNPAIDDDLTFLEEAGVLQAHVGAVEGNAVPDDLRSDLSGRLTRAGWTEAGPGVFRRSTPAGAFELTLRVEEVGPAGSGLTLPTRIDVTVTARAA